MLQVYQTKHGKSKLMRLNGAQVYSKVVNRIRDSLPLLINIFLCQLQFLRKLSLSLPRLATLMILMGTIRMIYLAILMMN